VSIVVGVLLNMNFLTYPGTIMIRSIGMDMSTAATDPMITM
jgi:hypothetical protein